MVTKRRQSKVLFPHADARVLSPTIMSTSKKNSDSPASWEELEEREADNDGSDDAPILQDLDVKSQVKMFPGDD